MHRWCLLNLTVQGFSLNLTVRGVSNKHCLLTFFHFNCVYEMNICLKKWFVYICTVCIKESKYGRPVESS